MLGTVLRRQHSGPSMAEPYEVPGDAADLSIRRAILLRLRSLLGEQKGNTKSRDSPLIPEWPIREDAKHESCQ
jgi:hypothetical protein